MRDVKDDTMLIFFKQAPSFGKLPQTVSLADWCDEKGELVLSPIIVNWAQSQEYDSERGVPQVSSLAETSELC